MDVYTAPKVVKHPMYYVYKKAMLYVH